MGVPLLMAGCGGSSNSNITPASQTYVRGNYTGSLYDPANVFGEGAVTWNLTYNDTEEAEAAEQTTANGTLTYTPSGGQTVTIPVDFNTFYEPNVISFTVAKFTAPTELLVDSGGGGYGPDGTNNNQNQYSGTGTEYTYSTSGTPTSTSQNSTVIVTFVPTTPAIKVHH